MCDDSEFDKEVVYQKVEEFAQNGFRTLGVAYKKPDEPKFHFVGLIPLFDPPLGVEVKMVTGDNIAVARYIAKLLGIGDKIYDIKQPRGETYEEYTILAEVISKAIYKKLSPHVTEKEAEKFAEEIAQLVEQELEKNLQKRLLN